MRGVGGLPESRRLSAQQGGKAAPAEFGALTQSRWDFAGQVAIVTGASGGIGRAIALDLLKAGARVAWVDRRLEGSHRAVASLPGAASRSILIRADISREAGVRTMTARVLDRFGQIDVLVNSAGLRGPTLPVVRLARGAWQSVIEANLTGPFLCVRHCLKHMLPRRRGSIVNMDSVAGRMAYPLRAAYAASKWGLIGLTLTLAQECGESGIRVNAVCPGPVEGPAMDGVIRGRAQALRVSTDTMRRGFLGSAALGRMVTPADVSQAVLFLCSEAARNITGQVLEVSAGFGLCPV